MKNLRHHLPLSFAFFISYLLICPAVSAQKSTSLLYSPPETEGVSPAGIDSFLNSIARSKFEFHSLLILRHGKVVAQGWWDPYSSTLKHSLYSTSKSFTSTAIGFAVAEKRLTVNDKVISFFPESLPDTVKPFLAQLTVKDLLTMSAGQEPDPTSVIPFTADDWVKLFLATPIVHKPGTKFLYNTMATFMLSAIVQKVTGQKEIDYLKPRLFDPLEIKGMDWEVNKQGINTGGWGLRLKTEDLAKMGQLYLQKGKWKGKQLLPKQWINEATTFKIDQAPNAAQSKRDSSDWMQGYCYQFWRCRHNAFRADGAFGQYIIVMPDQDAVIAITSEAADMQGELNLIWQYLLPAMNAKPLPVNREADAALRAHLGALRLQPPANISKMPKIDRINNIDFTFQPNDLNIRGMHFNFAGSVCKVVVDKDSKKYNFTFEAGKWAAGETLLQGPGLLAKAHEDFSMLSPYKIECSYSWVDDNTLQLKVRYIESPHTETITCHIAANQLNATVEYSYLYGKNKIALVGNKM